MNGSPSLITSITINEGDNGKAEKTAEKIGYDVGKGLQKGWNVVKSAGQGLK